MFMCNLLHMGIKELREALAANLSALMAASADKQTPTALARYAQADQTTIARILNGEFMPRMATLVELAKPFGLQAWQLLIPPSEQPIYKLLQSWNAGRPEDRRLLLAAAKSILDDIENSTESAPPT